MTTREPTATETKKENRFIKFIKEYPSGSLGRDLEEALAECVESTLLYGKSSALTFKVNIKPVDRVGNGFDITTDIGTKPARSKPPTATYFPTAEGGLSRRDPEQPQIPGTED